MNKIDLKLIEKIATHIEKGTFDMWIASLKPNELVEVLAVFDVAMQLGPFGLEKALKEQYAANVIEDANMDVSEAKRYLEPLLIRSKINPHWTPKPNA